MNRRRGQVIVMVTLALFAMCGMMGLAVDLGWAYFVEKSAQAAADAAAIAAVSKALDTVGESDAYSTLPTTSGAVGCASIDPGSVLGVGCQYAQQNGFTDSENGRQRVWMAAGIDTAPPTVPKVGVMRYWATATVAERIPQLFSAVLGNRVGGASARATAAIIQSEAPGSLYTTDRQYDYGNPHGGTGNDIFIQGGGKIQAGGDVYMASTAGGTLAPGAPAILPFPIGNTYYAGEGGGSATVEALNAGVFIRGSGWVEPGTEDNYKPKLENEFRDSDPFRDPWRGMGQPPPPPPAPSKVCAVPGGDLDAYCVGGTCGPGYYFAVNAGSQATGGKLTLSKTNARFGTGGFCATGASDREGFGEYVFFGGLDFGAVTATFEAGRYVLAGAKQGSPPSLWSIRTQTTLTDNTPLIPPVGGDAQAPGDAGEIFIFTDTNYPGLWIPNEVLSVAPQLRFGTADLHAGGAAGKTEINLHGLNRDHRSVPADLKKFSPVVFWQDQQNSTVKYTSGGYIDCGQSPEDAPVSTSCLDNPKMTDIRNGSPEMNLKATPGTHLWGAVYQPRGAWIIFHGGQDQMVAPLQVVTGSISVRGGPTITLQPISMKMLRHVVGLVE